MKQKRGYVRLYQPDKPRFSFFIIKLQGLFEFTPDWYRKEGVRRTAAGYFWKLRGVVQELSHLRPCLKRCRHCGILFLTHPRNAQRSDINCPFGCREALRKRKSIERSTAYYRTPEGKIKKQQQNARREGRGQACAPDPDQPVIVHLKVVTSLIEGRAVALSEIFSMVRCILRQHSIEWIGDGSYNAPYLYNPPP